MPIGDDENASQCEKVWKEPYLPFHAHKMSLFNHDVPFFAIFDEVEEAQEMQVWCIMPFIGKCPCYRRSTAEENLETRIDVGEIRYPDNDLFPNPQGLLQDCIRSFNLLKALIQNDEIEGFILVISKAAVDIVMEDAQASRDALKNGLIIDFNPLPPHILLTYQKRQEFPIAAPQIKHG